MEYYGSLQTFDNTSKIKATGKTFATATPNNNKEHMKDDKIHEFPFKSYFFRYVLFLFVQQRKHYFYDYDCVVLLRR